MLSALLAGCGLEVPRPEIKEGEFDFIVTYEYNGEIKTVSGVYVCEFSGISWALVRVGRPDVTKHIVYFLAQYSGQQLLAQDSEVSTIALMTYEEAMESFQFESSRRILREAAAFLEGYKS